MAISRSTNRRARFRAAIDTCVLVAYLTGDQPEHADGIRDLWGEVIEGRVELLGSTLLMVEALGPPGDQDFPQAQTLQAILENPSQILLASADRRIAIVARDLRIRYGLQGADSVHVATAIRGGADAFFTTDHRILNKQITEIEISAPRGVGQQPAITGFPVNVQDGAEQKPRTKDLGGQAEDDPRSGSGFDMTAFDFDF